MQIKLCVVVGEFHKEISETMLQYAKNTASKLNVEIKKIIWIPGSFEAPLALKEIFELKKFNAVVLLGYIEKGETLHGEVIGRESIKKILDLQIEYRIPVGYGVIGPGATIEQAKERMRESAEKAIEAAVKMCELKQYFNKNR